MMNSEICSIAIGKVVISGTNHIKVNNKSPVNRLCRTIDERIGTVITYLCIQLLHTHTHYDAINCNYFNLHNCKII